MQADPWWSFAMAINVFLVFFQAVDPRVFLKHLWLYCIVCYGLPAIPAFVFLFIHNPNNQPVYGDAVVGEKHGLEILFLSPDPLDIADG